eukprot:TRINITY_DN1886_c0_g1_i1.p1 TRINITY_DN1886_c0_g1~~TRINITY_DN1886_c0_g1_i1.p1  ORF type:complete len:327 (-),score=66.27 TRINITY_DN1886_c0_g1_i1:108-1088(-)
MALVQGHVTPGYRVSIVSRAEIDPEELRGFIGHKGEPWVGDMMDRWNDLGYDEYNLTGLVHKVVMDYDHPGPPELVAHTWIGMDGDTGLVGHVYTHPQHRGRGLATSLLHTLLEVFFKERGGRFLVLATGNPNAANLYKQLGFYPLSDDPEAKQVMARGVHPGFDPQRAFLGTVNRRTIHVSFEHEYYTNNGGMCVVEPIRRQHIGGCMLLLNTPGGPSPPKLPGLGVETGLEAESAILKSILAHNAGEMVCAVAVDPSNRRIHAIGCKRTGGPGDEVRSKAEVYAAASCSSASDMLFNWIQERVVMVNQGAVSYTHLTLPTKRIV